MRSKPGGGPTGRALPRALTASEGAAFSEGVFPPMFARAPGLGCPSSSREVPVAGGGGGGVLGGGGPIFRPVAPAGEVCSSAFVIFDVVRAFNRRERDDVLSLEVDPYVLSVENGLGDSRVSPGISRLSPALRPRLLPLLASGW